MVALAYLLTGLSVFTISYSYNEKIVDWFRYQSLGTRDYVVEKLSQMFINLPPHRVLAGLYGISAGLGLFLAILCLPNWTFALVFGVLGAVLGWLAPKPIVNWIYKRRVRKFTVQMVDALSLMANALRSGLSEVQAFSMVSEEMPNPIKQEINLVLNENRLGVPLEDALSNLAKRIQSDDVEMFVTSVNILKETGGNMAETFDTIVTTIRERIKVEGKIESMTANGFYQGIVVISIVPILGVILNQSDPTYMEPVFNSPYGVFLILAILILEVAAFFLILRITKIDI